MPATRQEDGAIFYRYPDDIETINFNGVDLVVEDVIEVMVLPTGRGYVQVLKALDTADVRVQGQGKVLVDGTKRNFTYWGQVVVTLAN